jgi:uncharacterized membrane protein
LAITATTGEHGESVGLSLAASKIPAEGELGCFRKENRFIDRRPAAAPASEQCRVGVFGLWRGEREVRTMEKITRTATINAPVQKVFQYWDDPANRPEVWPSLVEVKDVQPLPNGGTRYSWVYKMAGVLLKGTSDTTDYIPNQRMVWKSEGGIESIFTWTFQPEDGGTKVDVQVEYNVPIPVIGKLAERIIIKQNEREADTLLSNLKAVMEA